MQLPSLRDTVEKYELLAKKSLGQNFLLDMNITNKIIRQSLNAQGLQTFAGAYVYEVGPGPGGLTRAILAANPRRLTVIEMDSRCIAIMNELQDVVNEQLQIIEGDALKFNFTAEGVMPKHIVYQSLTLMFQKEVAERIIATPNNKNYGRLAVLAQLTCNIKVLLNLNPNCFVPAPKIWSTVLLFQPRANIPPADILRKVSKLTELAFGQRRKMIRQSLKAVENLAEICSGLNIPLTARAENLSPEQYLELAKAC